MVPDGPDRTAVRERVVHGEIESRVRRFEPGPIEWAAAFQDRGAATGGTAERRAIREADRKATLEQFLHLRRPRRTLPRCPCTSRL